MFIYINLFENIMFRLDRAFWWSIKYLAFLVRLIVSITTASSIFDANNVTKKIELRIHIFMAYCRKLFFKARQRQKNCVKRETELGWQSKRDILTEMSDVYIGFYIANSRAGG